MGSQFGKEIRVLRGQENLYLCKLPSLLEMDTTELSKIEIVLQQRKREKILTFTHVLRAYVDEFLNIWLSDQIYSVVKDEKLAYEAIQVTEEKVKFRKRKKN